jgi:aspartate/methionine/tyrosine aminotransferase
MRLEPISYMTWAKTVFDSRTGIMNLGTSGILNLIPPEELGIGPADFPRWGEGSPHNEDGLPALREAIAARYRVSAESVMSSEGTSLANFLVLAALIRPGDAVILEEPYYEPLRSVLQALGARIQCVAVDGGGASVPIGSAEGGSGHAAILDLLKQGRTPRFRAVVMTNPHNPSGRPVPDDLLTRIAEACESHGATLIVDEVYREVLFEDPPGCAARLHPAIVTTSSLTKVWGLSHLRIGWAIGPAALMRRATRLHDNLGVVHPFIIEAIGARLIADGEGMNRWRERARARVTANRAQVARLLERVPEFEGGIAPCGVVSFLRWRGNDAYPDAEGLCHHALEDGNIAIVPGRFFQRPDHVRIGAGGPEASVAAACDALARFLGR